MYENVPPGASRAIRSSAGELRAFSEFTRRLSPDEDARMRDAMRSLGFADCMLPGQRSIWRRVCAAPAARPFLMPFAYKPPASYARSTVTSGRH
jgi:hypothetical protein